LDLSLLQSFRTYSLTSTWTLSSHSFIHSFIQQRLYSPLLGPGLFFSFVIFFTQTVGLLGWVISPSQGHYLHTGQRNSNPRSQCSSELRQFMP
jgi:hypothetical protein